ncbi:MAG: hypothetical protein ACUVSL_06210 [Chloroflexus sp.]|uniref:hypothetical protein n=1 Tax=Chloroflexus sp. TaxID=1904827 RepID=UPI0040497913
MPVRMTDSAGLLAELNEQIGPRRATSAAEAMAAAQINARLRQAGFSVDTRSLPATDRPGSRFVPVALFLAIITVLTGWQPLVGLIFGPGLMVLLLVDTLYAQLPVWQRRYTSQNIVAARPVSESDTQTPRQPRHRLIILAPLDTPPAWRGMTVLIAPTYEGLLARLSVSCLSILVAVGTTIWPEWRWVLIIGGLGGVFGFWWACWRQPPLSQPDGGLAALAALVLTGQQLPALQHVEVWAVAVGAAYYDRNGIKMLLERYPFDPADTSVIGLGPLAGGQLAVISRSGIFRQVSADPHLFQLAMIADRNDPGIDLEPQPLSSDDDLLSPFWKRGFRTLSIQAIPQRTSVLDPSLADRAARLVVAIAQALDAENNHDLSVLRTQ